MTRAKGDHDKRTGSVCLALPRENRCSRASSGPVPVETKKQTDEGKELLPEIALFLRYKK